MSHRIARGWAWNARQPRRRVRLEVFHRDIYLGSVSAGMFRPDLEAQGIGDGRHGFTFHLPDDVSGVGFQPADLVIASAGPERWTLPFAVELVPSGSPARLLPADYRQALAPFLATVRANEAPSPGLETSPGRRPRIEQLCADIPDFGVSAFAEHIACKYGQADLVTRDPDAFWRWYLEKYVSERGRRLAPLSGDEIARLTRSRSDDRSYAAGLFLAPDAAEPAYEWAWEADRLHVADCAVPDRDIAALRATRAFSPPFPLSAFMRRAKAERASLRALPALTARQRKCLYALFMILGLRNPAILSYLPGEWMRRLLDGEFEAVLADLFGDDLAIDGARYARLIEAAGFDIAAQTFRGHRYHEHRVRGGPMVVTAPATVDVQLFGPFARKMGLGESCRRVAAALQATPFTINLVDYDIGTGTVLDRDQRLRDACLARLNILHLNAEEIPEALAYLPDVFSRTPTVAMPYWELNHPSRVHRLGVQAVDEIWAASRFLAEVFADSGKPVRWVGMCRSEAPVPTAAARAALRARLQFAPGTFVFLTTSDALSWAQRKNPLAVIEAFRAAFATEDVALIVKTHNLDGPLSGSQIERWRRIRDLCELDRRIVLVDQSFDPTTQRTLLAACDCLVSLHRAEGLGLDVIDALDLGTPVIATNYSGTRDLATPETAWLVDYEMCAVDPADYSFVEPGHRWAEPRLASAIWAMQQVVADRSKRDTRLRSGKDLVSSTATVLHLADRIAAAVGKIKNSDEIRIIQ